MLPQLGHSVTPMVLFPISLMPLPDFKLVSTSLLCLSCSFNLAYSFLLVFADCTAEAIPLATPPAAPNPPTIKGINDNKGKNPPSCVPLSFMNCNFFFDKLILTSN